MVASSATRPRTSFCNVFLFLSGTISMNTRPARPPPEGRLLRRSAPALEPARHPRGREAPKQRSSTSTTPTQRAFCAGWCAEIAVRNRPKPRFTVLRFRPSRIAASQAVTSAQKACLGSLCWCLLDPFFLFPNPAQDARIDGLAPSSIPSGGGSEGDGGLESPSPMPGPGATTGQTRRPGYPEKG